MHVFLCAQLVLLICKLLFHILLHIVIMDSKNQNPQCNIITCTYAMNITHCYWPQWRATRVATE